MLDERRGEVRNTGMPGRWKTESSGFSGLQSR
jgi:hypothetical protein